MLFFIRSYIPDFDGKIQKYFNVLDTLDVSYRFIGWDRIGESKSNDKNILFKKKGYIGGGLKNFFNLILWNIFIFITLCKNHKKISIVQAIDLDTALTAFVFCKIFSKKMIFDIYDKYTDTHRIKGKFKKILDKVENHLIKQSDLCILADEIRKKQHGIDLTNIIVIENVPKEINISNINSNIQDNSKIKIGYFGVLEKKHRGIEDLVNAIRKINNLELHIIGYGPLDNFIINQSNNNIIFYGSASSKKGLSIMSRMDIIVGMYYKDVLNHLYAAPNKYYEHLMLGKAFLTTKDIPPGIKTEKFNTGWSIHEGEDSLNDFFHSLVDKEQIKIKSINAKKIWENHYKNYYEDVYLGIYGKIIKKMKS
ncbi:hypothetical protein [Acinetobacter sp. BSP-28]|uniref:hypothetical protein n=1 Tax=Acinetobacter sp. BSP-28 TaxID=3344661 RepID=UPI00376F662A